MNISDNSVWGQTEDLSSFSVFVTICNICSFCFALGFSCVSKSISPAYIQHLWGTLVTLFFCCYTKLVRFTDMTVCRQHKCENDYDYSTSRSFKYIYNIIFASSSVRISSMPWSTSVSIRSSVWKKREKNVWYKHWPNQRIAAKTEW